MSAVSASTRAKPVPTPETQHYWQGALAGELRLQRCESCNQAYFPPRPFCPMCSSPRVQVFLASGKATLYSYTISHRPVPGFTPPFAIAVVQLAEGPRMMTNLVEVEQSPDALTLDMALQVTFLRIDDDIALPVFRPATPGDSV